MTLELINYLGSSMRLLCYIDDGCVVFRNVTPKYMMSVWWSRRAVTVHEEHTIMETPASRQIPDPLPQLCCSLAGRQWRCERYPPYLSEVYTYSPGARDRLMTGVYYARASTARDSLESESLRRPTQHQKVWWTASRWNAQVDGWRR